MDALPPVVRVTPFTVNPTTEVVVVPKVNPVPPSVSEAFANAEFGIGPAATDRDGAVVEFITDGTSQVGHDADGAAKLITDPPPPPPPPPALLAAAPTSTVSAPGVIGDED